MGLQYIIALARSGTMANMEEEQTTMMGGIGKLALYCYICRDIPLDRMFLADSHDS
jgi:hypothetical protein